MPKPHAYTVKVHDGKVVGFGLLVRSGLIYSVQFRDVAGEKIFRSTGETARPRAITKAEEIIREQYTPPGTINRQASWDQVAVELRVHFEKDNLSEATVNDYLDTMNQVRDAAVRPAAISDGLAQQWCNRYLTTPYARAKKKEPPVPTDPTKPKRGRKPKPKPEPKTYTRSPSTLHSRVRKLNAIWSKYLIKRLRVTDSNPWDGVDLPKLNAKPIRTLVAERVDEFFNWLQTRWHGWEVPALFFEVKAVTGCRLGDLAALQTGWLSVTETPEGKRYTVAFNKNKPRKARVAVLPEDLWQRLRAVGGKTCLWESYARDIVKYLKLRGVPTHRVNPEFDPERLVWWAKDEVDDFNKANPDKPKIQSHDFRKRFVTEGHRAGLDVDTVAAGVGMTVANARRYYLALDEEKAAATVVAKIGGTLRPKKANASQDAS